MSALTTKQIQILKTIRAGAPAPDGGVDPIDLDLLLDNLPYVTTKESMQFSIRALVARGLIEKTAPTLRRGRKRVCYGLTVDGVEVLTGKPSETPVAAAAATEGAPPSLTGGVFSAGDSLADLLASLPSAKPK